VSEIEREKKKKLRKKKNRESLTKYFGTVDFSLFVDVLAISCETIKKIKKRKSKDFFSALKIISHILN
jgi:hypothetical protein